jgi:hypothetical protein
MPLPKIRIGPLSVSKFIIGGNPISGFSHQTVEKDDQMRHYFSTANIKAMLAHAESLGVCSHIARADHHVMRYLMEYWDEGGRIQWLAQTCPEVGSNMRGVQNAIHGKASAVYIHGGVMDSLVAQNDPKDLPQAIQAVRDAGLPVGIAGHSPRVFEWAEKNLNVDFYMCCYYNPSDRSRRAEHVHGAHEVFDDADRDAMVNLIQRLSKPVIHYKILAAGRKTPQEAFAFAARHMRPQDAVCVGIYPGENPHSLAQDLQLLEEGLAKAAESKARPATAPASAT